MSSINFDNVYLLFLAIPLAILLAVPFILAVRKENANLHNITSGVLHILMAVIIAFTAAGTTVETTVTETDVYVVADVSYSANKNLDTLDNYIEDLSKSLPRNSRMGVVCFGKDQELFVRLGGKLKSVKDSTVDSSETDIEGALEYTGSLFRDDVIKRVVIITDGKQTYTSDSNALKRAADTLKAADIYVDAIFLDDNISSDACEVQINSVEATQNTYLNHAEKATVSLQSTYDTQATLSLYSNGSKISEQAIGLTSGYNTFSFSLDTSKQGTFDYEIRVEATDDESSFNNNITFTQRVLDSVNVLLITESAADRAAIESAYSGKATIDSYVNQTAGIPCSVEELCQYDEIIISNADISKIQNCTMFLSSLDTVVSLFGKSLITLGNTYIQSKGDDELKALDDMLPVRFGNAEQDSKLYTLVIDASRSMETLSKLIIAKRAASQLVEYLNEGDFVAVVIFHGDFQVVQPAVEISDVKTGGASNTTREQVLNAIENIQVTQGTFISLGLREALNAIKGLTFDEKQLMLISDGLTYTDEADNPLDIVDELYQNDVVVSAIDVGRGNDTSPTANIAKELLENIAVRGGGNYFYTPSETELDKVLFGELADELTETIIERYSAVNIQRRTDEVLQDVNFSGAYIGGYVNSKAKASATTVLTTDYQKSSGKSTAVPLYAYWSYGNGRVASFTSNPSGDWISPWSRTTYNTFFGNILSTNTPDEKIDYPFLVEILEDGGYVSVSLTPATARTGATAEISVASPDADSAGGTETESASMIFSSSQYTYRFATPSVGKYEIAITYAYETGTYTANYVYTVSYLPEYDSFATFDSSVLHKMLGTEGTVSEDGKLTIVNDESRIGVYILDLTVPMLVLCVVLFAVDVVIRKLRWEDIRSLFGKVKK